VFFAGRHLRKFYEQGTYGDARYLGRFDKTGFALTHYVVAVAVFPMLLIIFIASQG
jgi:hypothetical protein